MNKITVFLKFIFLLAVIIPLMAQSPKKYNFKISANAQKASVLYKAYSSGSASSYGSNRQDELGAVTQTGDKHEQYLYNTVKKYNRAGTGKEPGELTLDELVKRLGEYISYYENDPSIYKVRLVQSLYIIEQGGNSGSLPGEKINKIKNALVRPPGKNWPFFYRAVYSFLCGWNAYSTSEYGTAMKEFRSFLEQFAKVDKDKQKYMENYRAFSLFALGHCSLQTGTIKEDQFPDEWVMLKSEYPHSGFAGLINSMTSE